MFLRSSFNPVSFSPISFAGGIAPPTQDGHSGYWKLFFMQMQEEALKKPEGQVAKIIAKPPQPVVAKVVKKKPKVVKPRPKAEPVGKVISFPLVLTPKAQEATVYDQLGELPSLDAHSMRVLVQRLQVAVIINLTDERRKRAQVKRRKMAALLLLAA